ncbi:MAG: hypothetical protein K0Q79_2900 [Flavipsychrobacter sp.]|jgi:hypothetical protein|nr:hypothetical protein [Flavipsychrobacter sp.]
MNWLALILLLVCPFVKKDIKNDLQKEQLKGKVKTVTYFEWNDTTATNPRLIYVYDGSGNEIGRKYFMGESVIDNYSYQYKGQQKIEERTVSWRTEFSYGANSELLESKRYKVEDGSLMERMIFMYDVQGNDSITISYGGSGAMNYRMIIQIAENGDRVETSYTASGNIEQRDEFKYDTDGSPKEHYSYSNHFNSEFSERQEFYYYEFDKAGNWTVRKCVMIRGDIRDEIPEKRAIVYYQ